MCVHNTRLTAINSDPAVAEDHMCRGRAAVAELQFGRSSQTPIGDVDYSEFNT